jgi:hypothetical protein
MILQSTATQPQPGTSSYKTQSHTQESLSAHLLEALHHISDPGSVEAPVHMPDQAHQMCGHISIL